MGLWSMVYESMSLQEGVAGEPDDIMLQAIWIDRGKLHDAIGDFCAATSNGGGSGGSAGDFSREGMAFANICRLAIATVASDLSDVIACDVINPNHIDVEFNSIGGLESIKEALYELVILPLRRPELFSHGKLLSPQKGVLLYGPPGTGKTMLAKAIAKESGAVFINLRVSNLMSKWFGDAQKLVAAVFSLAHKLQPAIIFIDEVDSFLGQRKSSDHEALSNMKTEFMALWDGFTTDQNARVMVLAATNRPSELDEAILRRLPQAFEIGIPDRNERSEILKVVLKDEKVEDNIDYDRIAARCEGYTGSDILELCKKAAYFPIRELLDQEKAGNNDVEPRALSQADLERVLASSTKTKVAANEYSRLNVQSPSWNQTDPDFVQAAIGELSKLVTSHMLNLQPEDLPEDA